MTAKHECFLAKDLNQFIQSMHNLKAVDEEQNSVIYSCSTTADMLKWFDIAWNMLKHRIKT